MLPQGQTPSDEEYNSVDTLIDPMVEDLIARDIVFIEDVDAIEDKYFLHLGYILSGQAAAEFGMQNDQAIAARMVAAETDLNEMDLNSIRYRHMRTMRPDFPMATVAASSTLFST